MTPEKNTQTEPTQKTTGIDEQKLSKESLNNLYKKRQNLKKGLEKSKEQNKEDTKKELSKFKEEVSQYIISSLNKENGAKGLVVKSKDVMSYITALTLKGNRVKWNEKEARKVKDGSLISIEEKNGKKVIIAEYNGKKKEVGKVLEGFEKAKTEKADKKQNTTPAKQETPAPAQEPVQEPVQTQEPTPTQEKDPVEEPTPTQEQAPAPVQEETPTEEPTPAQEETPEEIPAEEETPSEEPAPTQEVPNKTESSKESSEALPQLVRIDETAELKQIDAGVEKIRNLSKNEKAAKNGQDSKVIVKAIVAMQGELEKGIKGRNKNEARELILGYNKIASDYIEFREVIKNNWVEGLLFLGQTSYNEISKDFCKRILAVNSELKSKGINFSTTNKNYIENLASTLTSGKDVAQISEEVDSMKAKA